MVKFTQQNGRLAYRHQCLTCGHGGIKNADVQTIVHPGHGDDTTLGAERPHLAGWRKRGW
jgi:hypothetical protein